MASDSAWCCLISGPLRAAGRRPSPRWRGTTGGGVRAVWTAGQLCCDRLLGARARLLVDLGAEFRSDDASRRCHASLQAPPVAVLLTLIRACDLTTVLEGGLGDGFAEYRAIGNPTQ